MNLLKKYDTVEQRILSTDSLWSYNQYLETEKGAVLQNRLTTILPSIFSQFRESIYREWKKGVKSYIMDKSDRQLKLQQLQLPDASNLYKPYNKNLVDKIFNKLYDTQIDFQTTAADEESEGGERSIRSMMERGFTDPANRDALFQSIKHQCIVGNGFGKADIAFDKKGRPQLVFRSVDVFNIFFNVNYDFYESGMPVIERKVMPINQILDEIRWIVEPSAEAVSQIVTKPNSLYMYDDSRVRDLWMMQDYLGDQIRRNYRTFEDDNIYKVNERTNNVCELILYREKDNLVVMINGYIVYDGENPLGCHPYVNFQYDPSTGRTLSRGICVIHGDEQLEVNALHNSFFDQIRRSTIEMRLKIGNGRIKGANGVLKPQHGKIREIEGEASLQPFAEFKVDPNILTIMQFISQEGDRVNGLTGYTGGVQEGIERSPFAAQAQVEITMQALKPAVEGIGLALTHIAKTWQKLLYNHFTNTSQDDKFKVKLANGKYAKIKVSDLTGDYHIVFANKSIITLYNEARKIQKLQTQQLLQSTATDPVSGRYLLEQDKLVSEMLGELGYSQDVMLTEEEYYAKILESEGKKLDIQSQLLDKQIEIAKKQAELQSLTNPPQQQQQAPVAQPQVVPQVAPTEQQPIDLGELPQ